MKNTKSHKIYKAIYVSISMFLFISCSDDQWLESKPNQSLSVISSIQDLQAVLDYSAVMNGTQNGVTPNIGEMSADNYYLSYSDWQGRNDIERNAYIWNPVIYNGNPSNDWNKGYQQIHYSNVALEGIEQTLRVDDPTAWDNVKGSALFFRAYGHFNIAQVFCKSYADADPLTDLGIPLRLSTSFVEQSERPVLQETYEQIIRDLVEAEGLLPVVPSLKTRPSKPAVNALLARIYLSMEDYENALERADLCLAQYSTLIDFKTLDTGALFPIGRFNEEVIFHSSMNSSAIWSSRHKVDSILYNSYETDDLRRLIFFRDGTSGSKFFKGSYFGSSILFSGFATDEILLTRAECHARLNNKDAAMSDLNLLLENRYSDSFTPLTAMDAEGALYHVIRERRKELIFRGVRWSDIKRLNRDSRFQSTLVRELEGVIHELPPGDPRYVLPIPDDVIASNPDMPQNQRD